MGSSPTAGMKKDRNSRKRISAFLYARPPGKDPAGLLRAEVNMGAGKQEQKKTEYGPDAVHRTFMKAALKQAEKAAALEETPIGCVIVKEGRIIARGYNRRNTEGSTLAHAEISAIGKACRKTGDWRLEGCTMYVTLEPCPMCAGALVQSRIDRVVIGAANPKAGCAGSVLDLLREPKFNHQAEVVCGVMEEECRELLQGFFRTLREKKRVKK